VKPAAFRYFAPRTLDEALELLAEHGDEAKVLAGGQSLVPAMNFRLAQPAVLVDLNRLPELAYVEVGRSEQGRGVVGAIGGAAGGECALRIGAMTRQRAVEKSAEVARLAPLLHRAMPFIAHPQIRNRGTFGGSLAHADPAAELPAVALALEARFLLRRRGAERWVAARDFYTGLFATVLDAGEMLAEVEIPPAPARTGWSFQEISRRHGDFALAGVAAGVTLAGDGSVAGARIAFLGVGEGPVLAERAAALAAGAETVGDVLDGAALAAVAEAAAAALDPPSDIHASSRFRRHLARVMAERALATAVRDAARESRPGRS
jgi:CO/xanthine dehydrogenase FAD-binding subunit